MTSALDGGEWSASPPASPYRHIVNRDTANITDLCSPYGYTRFVSLTKRSSLLTLIHWKCSIHGVLKMLCQLQWLTIADEKRCDGYDRWVRKRCRPI